MLKMLRDKVEDQFISTYKGVMMLLSKIAGIVVNFIHIIKMLPRQDNGWIQKGVNYV